MSWGPRVLTIAKNFITIHFEKIEAVGEGVVETVEHEFEILEKRKWKLTSFHCYLSHIYSLWKVVMILRVFTQIFGGLRATIFKSFDSVCKQDGHQNPSWRVSLSCCSVDQFNSFIMVNTLNLPLQASYTNDEIQQMSLFFLGLDFI